MGPGIVQQRGYDGACTCCTIIFAGGHHKQTSYTLFQSSQRTVCGYRQDYILFELDKMRSFASKDITPWKVSVQSFCVLNRTGHATTKQLVRALVTN